MADPYEKNGRWYVRYKDGFGRWRDRATSARTKSEARRLAAELAAKSDRQRLGLEPLPERAAALTFGELLDRWWTETGPRLRSKSIRQFTEKHFRAELGALALAEVDAGRLEALIAAKAGELSPKARNDLRAAAYRVFAWAIRRKLWAGANPAAGVPRLKVPKRLPRYLQPDEVRAVLAVLDRRWRPIFATAFYLGLRRGEILALHKSDVDLADRTLRVGRSNGADTTKGGHEDLLPIPDELAPWLEAAVAASRSELVFPAEDGEQRDPGTKLQHVLRRALGRAGIVTGYVHKCRRKGCGFEEQLPHPDAGRCPKCNMRLWPKALPKKLRFHDLRHSTATLLLKAGVPLATVQRILRHTDPRITAGTYGHLDLEDLRAGLAKLTLGPSAPRPPEPRRSAPSARAEAPSAGPEQVPLPFAATLLLEAPSRKSRRPRRFGDPEQRRGLQMVGETGFEREGVTRR